MLPFDFDYYRPDTLKEAVELYQQLEAQGRRPLFFSGGTELLTLGRIDMVYTDAVIDIKNIKECTLIGYEGEYLVLGSTLSLTQIEEANPFPLLTKTSSEIADHTARGKITLGGNICGQIFYREAVLPFLAADSQVVLAGPAGVRVARINDIFQQKLQLQNGEFLVQIVTSTQFIEAPFISIKRRQQWDTGYPLITVAALKIAGEVRVAISGLCPFPFRSREVETALNRSSQSIDSRVDGALAVLPKPVLDDVEGSAKYRLFVLRNVLADVLLEFERVGV